MILTILRQEYLRLVQAYLEATKEEREKQLSISYQCCTARLIQLFKWLTKDGTKEAQITRREIHEKLLGEHGKDAIAAGISILKDGLKVLRVEINNRETNERNGQVKTLRYQLDCGRLMSLLEGDVESSPPESEVEEPEGETENTKGDWSPPIDIGASSSSSSNTPTKQNNEGEEICEEEIQQIKAVIADAPFMNDGNQDSKPVKQSPDKEKFSAAITRTVLERLRDLNIPPTQEVRSLVAQTPEAQLDRNISALEEEAATKGLKSSIGAFKYFIKNNCQPRDERQSWLHRAAAALGKERRDRLIQAVTEYAGALKVFFTNGRQIALAQAQRMTWEEIAVLGGEP